MLENQLTLAPFQLAPRQKGSGTPLVLKFGGEGEDKALRLSVKPFKIELVLGGEVVAAANAAGLFHFEHYREKPQSTTAAPNAAASQPAEAAAGAAAAGKKIVDYNEFGHAIYEDGTTSAEEDSSPSPAPATPPPTSEEIHEHALVHENDGIDLSCAWEERFGSHTDSKPRGPSAVGIDISFPRATHLHGIPEHASSVGFGFWF